MWKVQKQAGFLQDWCLWTIFLRLVQAHAKDNLCFGLTGDTGQAETLLKDLYLQLKL